MEALRAAALRVLVKCCGKDLERILQCNAAPEDHLGLPLSVIALADQEPELAQALYVRPLEVISLLNDATLQAQSEVKSLLERRYTDLQEPLQHVHTGSLNAPSQLNVYQNTHVRLLGLPSSVDPRPSPARPPLSRVGCSQLYQLLTVTGTVVRSSAVRMWESSQVYECTRCKGRFSLKCSVESGGAVDVPEACPIQASSQRNPSCAGIKFKKVPGMSIYSGFQEIRLQAATACLGLGEPPASLTVVLQDELADTVKPGDSIEVVGVLVPRWLSTTPGQRCELELVLLANNVTVCSAGRGRGRLEVQPGGEQGHDGVSPLLGSALGGISGSKLQLSGEVAALFEHFWRAHEDRPLMGRNKILAEVCPGVTGLLPVKLAALLVLVGGVARRDEGGSHIRGELHLMLVGDPGTGKSQLMKWSCQASPGRAVLTTGRGSSGAGLTVSAVREGNSWALEAGALVLADGGLCCIDEFDGIRPAERAVIHEGPSSQGPKSITGPSPRAAPPLPPQAMEQQTVHVAKAGLVTSLSTRTAIMAAINPRPGTTTTCARPLTEVTGLDGPLLSRFDLVLLLADSRHPEWDRVVSGHVLARRSCTAGSEDGERAATTGGGAQRDASSGQPIALAAAGNLKAQLSELALVGGEPGGSGAMCPAAHASQQQLGGSLQGAHGGSRMSIAQQVAARMSGMGQPEWGAVPGASHKGQWSPSCCSRDEQSQRPHDRPGFSGEAISGQQGPAGAGSGNDSSAWTLDVIRSYIAWVKNRPPPAMTPQAERVLVAYYGAIRRAEERVPARSTIRALESLIRVSQAHARLMSSNQVLLRDAVVAVVLADTSMQLLLVPGAGDVSCTRFPSDPDQEMLIQKRVVLTALGLSNLLPTAPPMLPAPA